LEEENTALKAEVDALKEATRKDIHDPNTSRRTQASPLRTPLAPRSANLLNSKLPAQFVPELKAELSHVERKHAKLQDKYAELQNALDTSRQILRERTTAYHQWVDHAKQLNEQSLKRAQRIRKLEAKLAEVSPDPVTSSFSSDAGTVGGVAEPATLTPIHHYRCNGHIPDLNTIPQYRPRTSATVDDVSRSRSPFTVSNLPETSRSNLSSVTGNSEGINEKTSYLPPLHQNRAPRQEEIYKKTEPSPDTPVIVSERCVRKRKNIGDEEEDVPASVKVKTECGHEPLVSTERRFFAPQESIDFDAESPTVATPKKHTKYQPAPILHNNGQRPSDGSRIANITSPTAAGRSGFQTNDSAVLQSLDNQDLRPGWNLASASTNRISANIPRGLTSLAEDGNHDENINPSDGKTQSRASVLTQLLNTPSPAYKDGALQSGSSAKFVGHSDVRFQIPKKRELPFGKDGRKKVSSALTGSRNASSPKITSPVRKKNHDRGAVMNVVEEKMKTGAAPLRQLPKAKLRLDDFRINPYANEGYDYAFTDVVRNKQERACLQGCVKENCCGYKFRPLAHAARALTGPYEFRSLLESYLGDDCHRLSTMSEAEKEALWVEAKIRELANENGKHRHRFPRMSTPPGFWRADFPSTQEGEEYNEEAAKLEREIIEERYREAMRPGGLWIFQDE
jgi:hypothetical protein